MLDSNDNLLTTINLIADHLAIMDQRLAAIEEDQRRIRAVIAQAEPPNFAVRFIDGVPTNDLEGG